MWGAAEGAALAVGVVSAGMLAWQARAGAAHAHVWYTRMACAAWFEESSRRLAFAQEIRGARKRL